MSDASSVLKEALAEAEPSGEEIREIESLLNGFLEFFRKTLRGMKIDAEVFVGGSFAKKTLVKKDRYDVDVFIRFSKKYFGKDLSELVEKALKSMKLKIEKIHGSRDYFKMNVNPQLYFEIVPIMEISNPKEAENITDLSYYHVRYLNRRLNERLRKEIILAKAFCHANRTYGAESHIKGFSGYSLELLIYHYKSFMKFLKKLSKSRDEKIIIDIEKRYKNKSQVMMDMNSSKLESPVILIDPTYKQRNALATLSDETFERFRKAASKFIKNPSIEGFREKKTDFSNVEKSAKEKHNEFILLDISTDVQEGAIAGSKLLKFYNFLVNEISKHFKIDGRGFEYDDKKSARVYLSAESKGREILRGPPESRKSSAEEFKKKHKKTFSKKGVIYAEESPIKNLEDFVKTWKEKNKRIIREMYVTAVEIKS